MSLALKTVIIVAIIFFLLIFIFRLMGYLIMFFNFKRKIVPNASQVDYSFVKERGLCLMEGFMGESNDKRKTYSFGKEAKKSDKLVILSKGHGSFSPEYKNSIVKLVNSGYDVFAFDAKGHGESDGKCPEGYQQWTLDLERAVEEKKNEMKKMIKEIKN